MRKDDLRPCSCFFVCSGVWTTIFLSGLSRNNAITIYVCGLDLSRPVFFFLLSLLRVALCAIGRRYADKILERNRRAQGGWRRRTKEIATKWRKVNTSERTSLTSLSPRTPPSRALSLSLCRPRPPPRAHHNFLFPCDTSLMRRDGCSLWFRAANPLIPNP